MTSSTQTNHIHVYMVNMTYFCRLTIKEKVMMNTLRFRPTYLTHTKFVKCQKVIHQRTTIKLLACNWKLCGRKVDFCVFYSELISMNVDVMSEGRYFVNITDIIVKRPEVARDLLVSHFLPGTLVTSGQVMYKVTFRGRFCNHYSSGKAMSISQPECLYL